MGKRYGSVSEMVGTLTDKDFSERFEEEVAKKTLGRALFRLRCSQGLTQAELAEKMDVHQSVISRIEHSDNDKIKFDMLERYARAFGRQISFHIHPKMNAAERIKHHVLEIRKLLVETAETCKGDEKMEQALAGLSAQYALNTIYTLEQAISKLEHIELPEPDAFQITSGVVEQATEDPPAEPSEKAGRAGKAVPA